MATRISRYRESMNSRSILVYDGDCSFCTSIAAWLERRFRGGDTVIAWQFLPEDGLARIGLSEADVRSAAWWIDERGRAFRGHLALSKALSATRGWPRLLGGILRIPPVNLLARAAYPVVARFRHRLPGGTPACRL